MDAPLQPDPRARIRPEGRDIGFLMIKSANDYDGEVGTKIPIYPGIDVCIGRDESRCSPFFRSNIVSSIHFRVYSVIYDDDYVAECPPLIYCEDQCSTNGTYINGIFIGKMSSPRNPYLLNDGDVISIRPYWTFLFSQKCQAVERDLDDIQKQEIELFKDRYDVSCKLLGSGIYGKVFLANEVSTQMQVACKIVDLRTDALTRKENRHPIQKGGNQTIEAYAEKARKVAEVRKKLMREMEFLSKLNHPNIVTLHKAFRSPHSLYIFSELAAGGDLFSFLQSNGYCLEDLHARVISRQVAMAVNYLHSQGVAHRDLKPENILVMRRGIGHRIVLTDFGCAGYTRTLSGRMKSIVGTYDYVAPEVHKTRKEGYTEAVDMWSLGVVTLCILTGDALITFDTLEGMSQSDIAILLANADDEHPKWNALNVYGKNFVKQLLVLDPEKRMTSRDAVKHDWFTKPARVAAELDKLYERANIFWLKRRNIVGSVEDLPDLTELKGDDLLTRDHGVQLESQTRKRIPDATASKYFGLERHLRLPGDLSKSKLRLNRKRVLEELKEAGSPFIDTILHPRNSSIILKTKAILLPAHQDGITSTMQFSEAVENAFLSSSSRNSTKRKQAHMTEEINVEDSQSGNSARSDKSRRLKSRPCAGLVVREVYGSDLFGTPLKIKTAHAAKAAFEEMSPYSSFPYEVSLDEYIPGGDCPSPNKLNADIEKDAVNRPNQRSEMSVPASPLEEETLSNVCQKPKKSLSRNFSVTSDDINLHDEVAQELPRLVTAKIFSHAIMRKKEQRDSLEKVDKD